MIIGVDEERLRKSDLTPNEAFLMKALLNGEDTSIMTMCNTSFMISKGLITDSGKLTEEGEKLVPRIFHDISRRPVKVPVSEEVEKLCNEYREYFPKGVKAGGSQPVRGTMTNIIRKMRKFKREFPQYENELILKVAKKYVDEQARNQFQFMKTAEYLIYKDNNSLLASLCEAHTEEEIIDGDATEWGESV